jgi:hypothetical protein
LLSGICHSLHFESSVCGCRDRGGIIAAIHSIGLDFAMCIAAGWAIAR